MKRLSKRDIANHNAAMALLDKDGVLTESDCEFILDHYQESAKHMNGEHGAFFTLQSLALDVALEATYYGSIKENANIVDLCAGIGSLAFAIKARRPDVQITCVEFNRDYLEVGKRLVPDANWVLMDCLDIDALKKLGHFDMAVSNPPFGAVRSMKGKSPRYTGGLAQYKVIDVAGEIADDGCFIIPQDSAGFKYSDVQCYQEKKNRELVKFNEQTGLELVASHLNTTFYDTFKDVDVTVEVVNVDYATLIETPDQADLFSMAS